MKVKFQKLFFLSTLMSTPIYLMNSYFMVFTFFFVFLAMLLFLKVLLPVSVVACSGIAGMIGMIFYEYIRDRRKVTHDTNSFMRDENEKSCRSCRLRREQK